MEQERGRAIAEEDGRGKLAALTVEMFQIHIDTSSDHMHCNALLGSC